MKVAVRTFGAICLAFQTATLIIVASPPPKLTRITGRIIAYRPVDRVAQVVSYSPNKETFLLATDPSSKTSKPTIIKIVYTHFGYSEIDDDILNKGVLLTMKMSRNKKCDESYAHFVSTSRVMTIVDDKSERQETSKPIIFTDGFNGASLVPDLSLKCYDLEKGNLTVGHQ